MNRNYTQLTAHEIKWAIGQRTKGYTWRSIATILNISWDGLQRACVPGFAEARAKQIRESRALRKANAGNHTSSVNPMIANRRAQVPPEVEADRDARITAPVTLTALLCGDPAPGQSALDKQRLNLAEKMRAPIDNKVGLS